MRFLADESCDFAVIRALRLASFDVVAVSETLPGAEDSRVGNVATSEERIVITEDKDFGQLVYAGGEGVVGVLLLRFPARARSAMAQSVLDLVEKHGTRLAGRFVVLQPGRVRITGLPRKSGLNPSKGEAAKPGH
jgi:predicted nuclease of predicted toxin-antitoxin system